MFDSLLAMSRPSMSAESTEVKQEETGAIDSALSLPTDEWFCFWFGAGSVAI